MNRTTAIVIGAGHAGLAASHRLTQRSIDHVVLERGTVGNSWRTERWPGLRLLTPNWQFRLPGQPYDGDEPDGFLPVAEVASALDRYARWTAAPVITGAAVHSLRRTIDGYAIRTTAGEYRAAAVVLATGTCNRASIPAAADGVPSRITQVTPLTYRGPHELPPGRAVVVGASATGVQLAAEIHRSGRPVTLSVGDHVRLPRTYRGRDIFWWLEHAGVLAERIDDLDELTRVRRLPSPQLVGGADRSDVGLGELASEGIQLVGRLAAVSNRRAQFSGSLANVCRRADLKMMRLLDRFDHWSATNDAGVDDARPTLAPTPVDRHSPLEIDLDDPSISTIVWATGYQPDYGWLDAPVVDARGRLRHDGGLVRDAPGMYALGLPVMRTRASTYIHGSADDSTAIVDDLVRHLGQHVRPSDRLCQDVRP